MTENFSLKVLKIVVLIFWFLLYVKCKLPHKVAELL